MYLIAKEKVYALRDAIGRGLSVRAAARAVDIDRNTAYRYNKILNLKQRLPETSEKMTFNISKESKAKIAKEAALMQLSPTMFISLLLETIAEDDLFNAVIE